MKFLEVALPIVMLSSFGCTNIGFSPGTAAKAANSAASTGNGTTLSTPPLPPVCDGTLGTSTVPTKMIFVVDQSGSNQSNPGCTISASCTDPGKAVRAGSIQAFLSDYAGHQNFSWAFDTFSGTTATALTGNGSTVFVNAAGMQSALNTFETITDHGDTPYEAALADVTATIANDPDLNSGANPQYIVVFMSDGLPNLDEANADILNDVAAIVKLASKRVTFNTIYYGPSDSVAAGLLQQMSQTGNGNFLNTNTNPTGLDFKISDLITVPCP